MGLHFYKVGFFAVTFLVSVSAVNYDMAAEGYATGFLSNCEYTRYFLKQTANVNKKLKLSFLRAVVCV